METRKATMTEKLYNDEATSHGLAMRGYIGQGMLGLILELQYLT